MCLRENYFDSVDSPKNKKKKTMLLSSAAVFPLSSVLPHESVEIGLACISHCPGALDYLHVCGFGPQS